MLSTLTAFRFLEQLASSTAPYGLYLEDDARPVIQFWDKFAVFMQHMEARDPDWEMAYLGTCLGIHGQLTMPHDDPYHHAMPQPNTRCFNAVLVRASAAKRILDRGSITWEYVPIDHLLNQVIVQLQLKNYWAQPPLFYEESKAAAIFDCRKQGGAYRRSL